MMINLQTRPGPWCKTASVQGVHVPRITPVSVTGSEFSSVPETATDTHTRMSPLTSDCYYYLSTDRWTQTLAPVPPCNGTLILIE